MSSLLIFDLSLGLFFLLLGFLVYRFPLLIAGYNTMNEKQRERIDIKGLKLMMCVCLIVGACILLILGLLEAIDIQIGQWPMLFVVLFLPLIMIILAQKYDKNENSKRRSYILTGIVLMVYIIVFIFIYPQTRPNTILIEGDKIEIKGSYGITFTSNDITSMQWNINAPKILMRTNGLSIGDIRKGEFRINNQEKATLFLENMKGP